MFFDQDLDVKKTKKIGQNTRTYLLDTNIKSWLEELKDVVDKRVLCDLLKYKIKRKARDRRAKVNELEENYKTAPKNATKTHRNEMLKICNVYRRNTINYRIILLKVILFVHVQLGMEKVKNTTNTF